MFIVYAYMLCLCKNEEIKIKYICVEEINFIYASLCWAFITYLFVYCYAWVKGELLWSLTLIHAYIYNSMSFVIIKEGEIVGPKAFHPSFDDD